MLTPFETVGTFKLENGDMISQTISNVIPVSALGASGIFVAMFVGILAARFYVFLDDRNFKIKLPKSVPENVSNMFETMIPASLVFVVFLIVRVLCSLTSLGTVQNVIYGIMQRPVVEYWRRILGSSYLCRFKYLCVVTGYSSQCCLCVNCTTCSGNVA